MIFAKIITKKDYEDFYPELNDFIRSNFENVESGFQSDAWIWVLQGEEKVAIDTFSSMFFEVKCVDPSNELLPLVLNCLKKNYELKILSKPEYESHEDQYS